MQLKILVYLQLFSPQHFGRRCDKEMIDYDTNIYHGILLLFHNF